MAYLKGVRMLCVDNEGVRQMIEEDTCRYDIHEVPCILVFFKNGRMDKYEGEDAFAWLYDRKQKMMTSSQMVVSAVENQATPPVKKVEVRTMNPVLPEDPFPHPVPPPEEPVVGRTPGDPVMVEVPESERSPTDVGNAGILKKKENIMNIAMSMAKQRESEFEANDPKKKAQEALQQQ